MFGVQNRRTSKASDRKDNLGNLLDSRSQLSAGPVPRPPLNMIDRDSATLAVLPSTGIWWYGKEGESD